MNKSRHPYFLHVNEKAVPLSGYVKAHADNCPMFLRQ